MLHSVTGSNDGLYARSLRPLICNDGNVRQSETNPGQSCEKVLSIYNGMAVAAEISCLQVSFTLHSQLLTEP